MKTIHKYQIILQDVVTLRMPKGAEILSFQKQGEEMFIWAKVDPVAPIENRVFRIFGTGHELPDYPLKYIGTIAEYHFVWHLFEITTTPDA